MNWKNIFLTAIFFLFLSGIGLAAPNLLNNPDFEDITILPWISITDSTGLIYKDSLYSYSGSKSAKLYNASGSYNGIRQFISVEPGETYEISGYVKTSIVRGTCRIEVQEFPSRDIASTSNVSGINQSWRRLSTEATIPSGVNFIEFRIIQENNPIGTCWFDDVRMEKVETIDFSEPNTTPRMRLTSDTTRGEAPLRVRFDLDCTDAEDGTGTDDSIPDDSSTYCEVVFDAANSGVESGQSNLLIVNGNLLSGVQGTYRDDITFPWNTRFDKWVEVEYDEPGTYRALGIAVDSEGAKDTDTIWITVEEPQEVNFAPVLFGIPNIQIEENSAFTSSDRVDLFVRASDNEDSDTELDFEITSQTNSGLIDCFIVSDRYVDCDDPTSNQTGSNIITVRVTDRGGLTDNDSFRIDVERTTPTADCSGIYIIGFDMTINESSSRTVIFNLWNSEDQDFRVTDFRIDESSSYISISNTNTDTVVGSFEFGDLTFEVNTSNISGDRTATAYAEVEGEFEDGTFCTDSDIGREPFTVYIDNDSGSNDPPRISNLPDVEIDENDNADSTITDLWAYASDDEDSDSQLDFRIMSQNNTSLIWCSITSDRWFGCDAPRNDRTGISTIRIEVEDSDGETDTDTFIVEVVPDGVGRGSCGDIDVDARTVYMDESDRETVRFDIRNRANDDFRITDVDVYETSSYLRVRDFDYDSTIREDSEGELEIDLESFNVPGDREVSVYIDIRGRFDNGRTCSFSDVGRESFRVRIDNDGGSSSICNDIDLRVRDITVNEDSRTTRTIEIENNSNRRFTINSVRATDNSRYFDVSVRSKPSSIQAGRDADISLRIDADSVSRDREGEVTLSVSGRFSNGRSCSSSSIRERFDVTVDNRGTSNRDDDDRDLSGTVKIDFSETFVTLDKGRSEGIRVTVTNDLDGKECFDLRATSSSFITPTLSSNNICLSSGEDETITMTIRADQAGSGNVQFKASYDGKSKSRFVSVEVVGAGLSDRPRINAAVPSDVAESRIITLTNTGNDLENVVVSVVNRPEGVIIRPVTQSVWRANDTIELELEIDDEFEGLIDSTIRVNSDTGSQSIPLEIEVEKVEQVDMTGFVGVATTAGMAIGLLILVVLAVIGILSVFSRK